MRNEFAKISDPNTFISCSGDRYNILYSPVVLDDGTIFLEESGKEDIQEKIDSYRDQTDISYVMKRIALGDTSMLRNDGMYGDFTEMPKTYAEALQMVMDSEKKFSQLPLDVRNQFDNDYRKWFATSGSEDWMKKMAPVLPGLGEVKPGADAPEESVGDKE